MPTISERLHFNFNGQPSQDFDVIHVHDGSGMYEDTLVASRVLNEEDGKDEPIFNNITHEPISFTMMLAFQNGFNDQKLLDVIDWLNVDFYSPLYFEGAEDKIFMCMPIDEQPIYHNGNGQGFLIVNFRCKSHLVYSNLLTSPLESSTVEKTFTIINDSHSQFIYPEISITKRNSKGNIIITSVSDGNKNFQIRDLENTEGIYLHSKKEIIESDLIGVYRYDKISGDFPKLKRGQNTFKVTGDCTIQFRYRKEYRF